MKKSFGKEPLTGRSSGASNPVFGRGVKSKSSRYSGKTGRSDDRAGRSFDGEKPRRSFDSDRPKRRADGDAPRKPFGDDRPRKHYDKDRLKRSFDGEKPRRSFDDERPKRRAEVGAPSKPFGDDRPRHSFDGESPRRSFDSDRLKRRAGGDDPRKSFHDERPKRRSEGGAPRKILVDDRPRRRFNSDHPQKQADNTSRGSNWQVFENTEEASSFKESNSKRSFRKPQGTPSQYAEAANGQIRLNRYIANTGLCSRREADELIEAGVIKVNGKIVTKLGTKIGSSDTVHYGDQLLRRERMQYVLLNKPKDFITTTDDPQDRKTVLQLVEDACRERIYPVGRLDRNTTGLLLLTNDGDIADRLMHPRFGVRKMYHVTLDKALRQEDFEAIKNGIDLEDGPIKADELSYVGEGGNRREVGIVLHSGRNRIVRRIFEELGYVVAGLDRVVYAGLTKKNLPRGRWRHLSEEEIGMLKMTLGGTAKQGNPQAIGYRKKKKKGRGI